MGAHRAYERYAPVTKKNTGGLFKIESDGDGGYTLQFLYRKYACDVYNCWSGGRYAAYQNQYLGLGSVPNSSRIQEVGWKRDMYKQSELQDDENLVKFKFVEQPEGGYHIVPKYYE